MYRSLMCLLSFTLVLSLFGTAARAQENQIINSEFDDGFNSWGIYFAENGFTVDVVQNAGLSGANAVVIDVTDASATSSIGISQGGLLIEPGVTYPIGFTVRAEQNREMVLLLQADINGTSWPTYVNRTVQLTTSPQDIVIEYTHSGDTIGDDPGENLILYLMLKGTWWPMVGDDLNGKVWFDRVYFGAEPPIQRRDNATEPNPFDEAEDMPRNIILSWVPGEFADKHDVYFGNNFDDVTNSSTTVDPNNVYKGRQDDNSYTIPETLDFGRTYYWRIDEVNAPTDYAIIRGDVWSFTVEPYAHTIDGEKIIAEASSKGSEDTGPEKTIDGSGLNDDDQHSTDALTMWLSHIAGPEPAWIKYEFDGIYKLYRMLVWNYNWNFEPQAGFGFKDVKIEYSTDDIQWKELGNVPQFEQGTGRPDYTPNTIVDFNGVLAKYVRITAVSNWSIIPGVVQCGLSEVRFLYLYNQARYPNPQEEAIDAGPDVVLSWRAGREATTHEVYFSTSKQTVMSGTDPTTIVSEASYDVGTLQLGQTYFWRVDEVNNSEIPPLWQGVLWSFSTPDFLVVDDFETYDDTTEGAVWATWTGWEQADNGVYVGHEDTPYCERTIIHGGIQSMPFYYDNTGGVLYSEAKADISDLKIDPNWTKAGIKALTLYFYGDPDNTPGASEQLYVKLNGVMKAYDGDADDIQEDSWHEWNIDLTPLSDEGVDLQNITEIIIGIGQVGASGIIYIDDIHLYPARCIPGILKPAADLNDDCIIDYADIEILASNWLMDTYQVIPVDPGTTNLAGHWTFDNAANVGADSMGNNNGEINGNASRSTNAKVGAGSLALDGDSDFLNVRGGDFFSALDDDGNGFTAAAWVQFAYREEYSLMRIFSTNMSAGGTGGWGFGIIQSPACLRFTTYGIRDYDTGDLSSYLPESQWTHIAFVYKSDGDADFYINGSWAETVVGDFSMNNTQGFLIGGLARPGATEWFEGLIDDLRIYSDELSQGEIGWLAGKTAPYAQELSLLLAPRNPAINAHDDDSIDLRDYSLLADQWLNEQLWPES